MVLNVLFPEPRLSCLYAQPKTYAMNSVLSPPGVWFVNNRKIANWDDTSRARIVHVQTQLRPLLCQAVPDSCRHLRGRGHVKGAVRSLHHAVNHARYVARFDIKSYYQSMHHDVLLSLLDSAGAHAYCQAVVADYLSLPDRRNTGRGMVAGGSLSPGLGALYLAPLDRAMAKRQRAGKVVSYVRYMDDYVILTKTRWQLRRAIADMHTVLESLRLCVHRTKRFIGKTSHGFDFLGYQIHPGRAARPSREAYRRLRLRARRLYEREGDLNRLRQYLQRWWQWLHGGLDRLVCRKGGLQRLIRHILSHLDSPQPRCRDG
jgi:RNA-directed DNA polymerase